MTRICQHNLFIRVIVHNRLVLFTDRALTHSCSPCQKETQLEQPPESPGVLLCKSLKSTEDENRLTDGVVLGVVMGNCHFANRSEALVVSGGCCLPKTEKRKALAGQWKCIWTWAGMSKVERLYLGVMSFDWTFDDVKTAEGVSVTVPVKAVVQIIQDIIHFHKASEQFLGKNQKEIGQILFPVVDAHLRLVYDSERLEDNADTEYYFSSRVQKSVAPDLWDMGMLVHKLVITDVCKTGGGPQLNGNVDPKVDQKRKILC